MILGSRFKNDPVWIQDLQHDLYWGIVAQPFEMARTLYLRAEKIIGIETQIGKNCKVKGDLDHRVLQYFHDAIAMKFRYESRNNIEIHPEVSLDGVADDDDIKQTWLRFYKRGIDNLFEEHLNLPRQILIAATYPNPDKRGKDAEDIINIICDDMNLYIKENE